MIIEHVAMWTQDLEALRRYYQTYFEGRSSVLYINPVTGFQSYFLSFDQGSRLELMMRPGVPPNLNDPVQQYRGLIHLAFGVGSMQEVEQKARQLKEAGFPILRGPRKTGDNYYEFETLDPEGNRLEVVTPYINGQGEVTGTSIP